MRIVVNGETTELDATATIAKLLEQYELSPQRVAIEVNEALVRRQEFADTTLHEGDRIEIVTLVGGG